MVIASLQHPATERRRELRGNLGTCLLHFCELFGLRLNYETVGISVSNGGEFFSKQQRGRSNQDRPGLLCVLNPLDSSHDVGANSFNIALVRRALAHAYFTLVANLDRAEPSDAGVRAGQLPRLQVLSELVDIEAEMGARFAEHSNDAAAHGGAASLSIEAGVAARRVGGRSSGQNPSGSRSRSGNSGRSNSRDEGGKDRAQGQAAARGEPGGKRNRSSSDGAEEVHGLERERKRRHAEAAHDLMFTADSDEEDSAGSDVDDDHVHANDKADGDEDSDESRSMDDENDRTETFDSRAEAKSLYSDTSDVGDNLSREDMYGSRRHNGGVGRDGALRPDAGRPTAAQIRAMPAKARKKLLRAKKLEQRAERREGRIMKRVVPQEEAHDQHPAPYISRAKFGASEAMAAKEHARVKKAATIFDRAASKNQHTSKAAKNGRTRKPPVKKRHGVL